MATEIRDLLQRKLDIAREQLNGLIQEYMNLNDDARLEKTNFAFDQITSYIQIERNLLFPVIHKRERGNDLIDPSIAIHEDMNQIMERAVMLHVDEPDFTFYDNLTGLLALLNKLADLDQQSVWPWLEKNLTEEDTATIIPRLQDQTIHESLPAFRSSEGSTTVL
jgi:hypothetical protein